MDYPFTAIPKWFFPLIPVLSDPELRIMLVVWNQTTGWQTDTNVLAYSFLMQETGINSRSTISKALTRLEGLNLIRRQPKRIAGQKITVTPATPVEPAGLVHEMDRLVHPVDRLVHEMDSQSPPGGPIKSTRWTDNRYSFKEINKETPTKKFSPDQEKGLAILVGAGIEPAISSQLIVKSWNNGRDLGYITQITGYVASVGAKNPPGLIRTLIERNADRPAFSEGPGRPEMTRPGRLDLSDPKYGHNGRLHFLTKSECAICQKEAIANEC